MSKIGKKPVLIPQGVEIKEDVERLLVKGPKGEMVLIVPNGIKIELKNNQAIVTCLRHDKRTRSCYGTMRSLIQNAVIGVTEGWEKQIELVGVGFHVVKEEGKLVLTLGFSHPVEVEIPGDLTVGIEENKIIVKGVDKQKVGLFAAQVRKISPPDAYKGRGVRYVGEEIKLKPGKMARTEGEG